MLDNAEKLTDQDLEQVSGGYVIYAAKYHPGHPTRFDVIDEKGNILRGFEGKNLAESEAAAKQYAESIGIDSR